jgi:hypothetical protein
LKTFLTQIGPTLPLTLDPPIICFWKWIGWKDYEVQKRNLESVSAKNYNLFSPCACIPAHRTHPPTTMSVPVLTVRFVLFPSRTPPPNSRLRPWPSAACSVSRFPEAAGLTLFLPWISRRSSPSWPWRGVGRGGDRDGRDA